MQKRILVLAAYLCVFAGLSLLSAITHFAAYDFCSLGFLDIAAPTQAKCLPVSIVDREPASEYEYQENSSDVPTADGKPVFATKADVMISSAESFIESKDYQSAEKMAGMVTESYPEYIPGWLLLGYCRSLLAEYSASNEAYEKALNLGADPKMVYTRTAYNYLKLQDWENAKEDYLGILELSENDIGTLTQLGYLEMKLSNSEKAIVYYRKGLVIEPDNITIIVSLSKVMEKLGDMEEAKRFIEKAIAIEPENPKFKRKLTSILLKERSFKKALPILNELALIEPDNCSVHRNLGVALYELGEKKKAKVEFETVASLGGKMEGLHGPLADCLRVSGETSKAVMFIKEGIQNSCQQAWLYSIWGKILEDRKDYDGAIAKFSRAVRLGEKPWSDYARKQIARQRQLKKREEMLAKEAESSLQDKKHKE